MFKSKTSIFVTVIILLVIVIAVGVWIGMLFSGQSSNPTGRSPYAAVYMVNGGVYFGKLSWFPSPHMTDVYYLQQTQDSTGKAQLGIAAFTAAAWQPIDEIYLNTQQVAFWSYLQNGSQLAAQLANPAAAAAAQQQQGAAGAGAPASGTAPSSASSTSGQ